MQTKHVSQCFLSAPFATHACQYPSLVHGRKSSMTCKCITVFIMIFIATDSAQASTSAAALNGQKHQQSAEAASGQPLLAVDPRKLRGEEEMRRIFGARTMREEERDNANAGDQHPVSRSVAHLALAVFGSMHMNSCWQYVILRMVFPKATAPRILGPCARMLLWQACPSPVSARNGTFGWPGPEGCAAEGSAQHFPQGQGWQQDHLV